LHCHFEPPSYYLSFRGGIGPWVRTEIKENLV
jgi:hypothetical protein